MENTIIDTNMVEITFARPGALFNNTERLLDLKEAINNANRNLYFRHKVMLSLDHKVTEFGSVYVTLVFYEGSNPNEFKIGNHLRGIARYLIKKNPDFYNKLKVGNRLLCFRPISSVMQLKNVTR